MTHPPPLSRDRLLQLIQRMKDSRVVVVGDIMIDRYLYRRHRAALARGAGAGGDRARAAGQARRRGERRRQRRVAWARSCLLVGTVGDDGDGAAIRQELVVARLDGRHVVTVAGRPTTSKTRIIARSQQIVRIDDEVDALLDGPDLARLIKAARDALADADALLLEDYNKGALAPGLIAAVMEIGPAARASRSWWTPSTGSSSSTPARPSSSPTAGSWSRALGAAVDLQNRNALPEVLTRLKVDNLLVTLGAEGMLLVTKDGSSLRIPSIAREVYDVSGAGDTVTAWLGTALAAGASLAEAAQLANYAAGVEVGKPGVATVSPEEVLAVHEERFDQIGRFRRGGAI